MGRTPHEVSGLGKAGDHPAGRAIDPADFVRDEEAFAYFEFFGGRQDIHLVTRIGVTFARGASFGTAANVGSFYAEGSG
jgi:hypothetical protein